MSIVDVAMFCLYASLWFAFSVGVTFVIAATFFGSDEKRLEKYNDYSSK
jgi:hypothetical protein